MTETAVQPEDLWAIEHELSTPAFLGVPLGACLGSFYWRLLTGAQRPGGRDLLLNPVRAVRQLFSHDDGSTGDLTRIAGRVVITSLQDTARLTGLILPVVEALGAERCAIVAFGRSIEAQAPAGAAYLPVTAFYGVGCPGWRPEFVRVFARLAPRIAGLQRRGVMSAGVASALLPRLVAAARRAAVWRRALSAARPLAVITEADRLEGGSPLILAARALGIPTFSLMHGVINPPYGYTPVLADYILVWGEDQREELERMGTPSARIRVVGCPRLNDAAPCTVEEARERMGVSAGDRVALLASSPMPDDEGERLRRAFVEGVRAAPGMRAVVRLHASERPDEVRRLMDWCPEVQIVSNDQCTVDESIHGSDVIAVHNSGFGNDALMRGRPVVVLDVLTAPLRNGACLIERAGCPRAASSSEFGGVLRRIMDDGGYASGLSAAAHRYGKRLCCCTGADAGRAAAAVVDEVVAGGGGA